MEENEQVELEIHLTIQDTTAEELDSFTRHLLYEIRDLDVESAELSKDGIAPVGSKGDPITVGSIAVQALPVVLPSLITLMQSWANRGQGRTVKFKGKGIEFEGSPEQLQKILAVLEKQRKRPK